MPRLPLASPPSRPARDKNGRTSGFVLRSLLIAGLFAGGPQLPVAAQSQSQITSPIDDSSRVKVPHSTHPLAQPSYDAGPVDGSLAMQRIILVLGPTPEPESVLSTLLDS